MMLVLARWLLLSTVLSAPSLAWAAQLDTYAVLTSTGRVGTLKISTEGRQVGVDYRIDDNGRGPKVRERILLDTSGMPVRREITGTDTMGVPVEETFSVENGRARWHSLDDSGEASAGGAVYLDNKGSPWTTVHVLRTLTGSGTPSRPALPSGSVRLQRLRTVVVGARRERLQAYAIWGFGLGPDLVLARGRELVAEISPGWVTAREDLSDRFAELSKLAADLSTELLRTTSARLAHRVDQPVWLTHVKVFDPLTGSSSAGRNVVVYRGRVVGLRTEDPPAGAPTVDGGGGTLLPGLFDSHAHMGDWSALIHVASGVTFVRDPGNDNERLLELTERIERGELIGPRVAMSGFLEGKSQFSSSGGFTVSSVEDALDKVRWYADHGFWGVKIYNSMPPELVKPIAAEAHRLGLHVSGHVPAFMTAEQAIADGYDEINHINQLLLMFLLKNKEDPRTPFRFTAIGERLAGLDPAAPAVQRVVETMKARKITLDPTMNVFVGMLRRRHGEASALDSGWLDHVPATIQRSRKTLDIDVKPEQYPTYEASAKRMEQFLSLLHRQGIPLVPGTDDLPGLTLHSELVSWVDAGIPPAAVLTAATLGGARFLGRDSELGTIAVGKRADLYLVDGDPLKNIRDIRRGRLVVKDGAFYYPDELLGAVQVKPFATHAELRPTAMPSPAQR